jgi:GAF domain-containing protein
VAGEAAVSSEDRASARTVGAARDTDGAEAITEDDGFGQVRRLELDELLEQLIERARDVQATQSRLRALLRANQAVASAVELDDVLQHILDAARRLVDARYAALGVVDRGRLIRFLHTGMEEPTVTAIGHLPEGKGLLGRLIDFPAPLRLPAIGEHPSSVGFPEHHPPMRSFLGVPIRVGQRVFGNLYLTDKQGAAEFTADDEGLVTALAAAAGAAITNAGAIADSRRRQAWHASMAALSTAVLTSDDPDDAPNLILRYARAAVDCIGGSVAVPAAESGKVRVAAADGILAPYGRLVTDVEGTVYSSTMTQRRTVTIENLATDPRAGSRAPAEAGPCLSVPMLTELAVDGLLFLCRRVGEPPFDAIDIEMIETYAAHAALVLQLSRSRRDNELLQRADDRQHIAESLHHDVVQRLSRLGMDLQALAARVRDPRARAGLQAGVTDTDDIIRAIRTAVFALRSESEPGD